MILHIAQRIVFVIIGYLAAVAAGSAAFPLAIVVIGQFFPESEIWAWLGFGSIVMFAAPAVFLFVFFYVMVSTVWQAVAVHAATEFFGLRQMWLHVAAPIAIMLSAVFLFDAAWFSDVSLTRVLTTLAAALASALSGLVYWAIAGRNAGLRAVPPA